MLGKNEQVTSGSTFGTMPYDRPTISEYAYLTRKKGKVPSSASQDT